MALSKHVDSERVRLAVHIGEGALKQLVGVVHSDHWEQGPKDLILWGGGVRQWERREKGDFVKEKSKKKLQRISCVM